MEDTLLKRVLPNSPQAEMSVVGTMLRSRDAISTATEILTADDFYSLKYQHVFNAIVSLYQEGTAVDIVTLGERLKQMDVLDGLGGMDFVRDLLYVTPYEGNIEDYANIVHDKAMLRKIIRVTEKIANDCYQDHTPLEEILNDTERDVFNLVQSRKVSDMESIDKTVLKVIKKIEATARNNTSVTGIPTGFLDLDHNMSGLQPSDLILLAARPSMGKTAFALNIAQYTAIRNHVPTAIFSLEMSKEQLVNRLLSMESTIDGQSLRTGNLQDRDWDRLVESSGDIAESALMIDDTPGISIADLRSKCRKMKLEHGLGLIIIDYLQLMSGSGKGDSRQQEISEISRALKGVARELNVPVIALSQLSRACETRPDHRPMLSDLRESGAIEQDADVVMFLYRDEYYNKDSERKGITEVLIAKQRNGPTGTIELVWRNEIMKFANKER